MCSDKSIIIAGQLGPKVIGEEVNSEKLELHELRTLFRDDAYWDGE